MAARKPTKPRQTEPSTRLRARSTGATPGAGARRAAGKPVGVLASAIVPIKRSAARELERKADGRLVSRSIALLLAHQERVADSERTIGEHLLETYFDGDVELARSKSPSKPLSFASLAERVERETLWDEHDLRRFVIVAIVSRSLALRVLSKLTPDQLYRLGSIDALVERRKLAARIASGELAGHAVRDAIAKAGAGERSGGPRSTPRAVRLARSLAKAVERIDDDDALLPRALRALDSETRTEVARALDAAADKLRALERRVREGS
ncbi:MAG: hypothetical protein IT379_12450 [Deltaproteobacteria bacterium]|nr:hypothetical protein [Deltaproteobacteria bacterium]